MPHLSRLNDFSLELAQEFLSHFKQDPSPDAIPSLAEKYRLDLKSAEAFVEHYRVFYLFRTLKDEDAARDQFNKTFLLLI